MKFNLQSYVIFAFLKHTAYRVTYVAILVLNNRFSRSVNKKLTTLASENMYKNSSAIIYLKLLKTITKIEPLYLMCRSYIFRDIGNLRESSFGLESNISFCG